MERHRKTAEAARDQLKQKYSDRLPLLLSREQVSDHNTENDCLVIVHSEIYDVTPYIQRHPGGKQLIFRTAGGDVTSDFEAGFHSQIARMILEHLKVGTVVGSKDQPERLAVSRSLNVNNTLSMKGGATRNFLTPNGGPSLLSPMKRMLAPGRLPTRSRLTSISPEPSSVMDVVKWRTYKVMGVVKRGSHTVELKIALPSAYECVGLKPGEHVYIGRKFDGKIISRPYTPIRDRDGHIVVLVKRYETGMLSPWLNSLLPGKDLYMRGPAGNFEIEKFTNGNNAFVCIAGGTGITAVAPVMKYILSQDYPNTRQVSLPTVLLLHCNDKAEDALMLPELEQMVRSYSSRIRISNVISQGNLVNKTTDISGRITSSKLLGVLNQHSTLLRTQGSASGNDDNAILPLKFLICGPEGLNSAIEDTLIKNGWVSDDYWIFK
eukprot:CFRG3075T1